jgi:hypothetical protein
MKKAESALKELLSCEETEQLLPDEAPPLVIVQSSSYLVASSVSLTRAFSKKHCHE